MSLRLILNAVLMTAPLTDPAGAQDAPATDLAGRLAALEAEVRSLQTARSDTWQLQLLF